MLHNRVRTQLTTAAICILALGGTLAIAGPADAAVVDTPPIGTIVGSQTTLDDIWGMAIGADGTTYTSAPDIDAILGFAAGATGNVAPTVNIAGDNTGLNNPAGLAVDSQGNLWVADSVTPGSIEEFAADATGNVQPLRTIAGASTQLDQPEGIAIGSDGTIYVTSRTDTSVQIFSAGSSGDAAPSRTIEGGNTGLGDPDPYGIAIEPDGSIVVSGYGDTIETFAADASGNVAPVRTISGSNTSLDYPYWVAVDGSGDIYIADFNDDSVTEYPETANGNVSPLVEIQGSVSQLGGPFPIAIDKSGDVFVGNRNLNSITEYAPYLAVTGVSPASGPSSGGGTVTISGFGFRDGATVAFGGIAATDVTVVSSTTITAVVPAHAAGKVDVAVTQNGRTATAAGAFTYTTTALAIPALATTGVDSAPALAAGILLALVGGVLLIARRVRRAHTA